MKQSKLQNESPKIHTDECKTYRWVLKFENKLIEQFVFKVDVNLSKKVVLVSIYGVVGLWKTIASMVDKTFCASLEFFDSSGEVQDVMNFDKTTIVSHSMLLDYSSNAVVMHNLELKYENVS